MAKPFRTPYLDATSWISVIAGTGPYLDDLRAWLAAADRGDVQIVVSSLMPWRCSGGLETRERRPARRLRCGLWTAARYGRSLRVDRS